MQSFEYMGVHLHLSLEYELFLGYFCFIKTELSIIKLW